MKLYFVRHGESEANILHEFSNRGFKHGLTERGRQQSQRLAEALQALSPARIFTSPLKRAVETADILAAILAAPVEQTDALREYDCGVLEGRADEAAWAIYDRVWRDWLERQQWAACPDGGESFLDMKARFVPFIERLVQTHGETGTGLVLVGHGGLYRCMLPLVLHNVDFTFSAARGLANTALIVAELTPGGLVCRRWGEVNFAEDAAA